MLKTCVRRASLAEADGQTDTQETPLSFVRVLPLMTGGDGTPAMPV